MFGDTLLESSSAPRKGKRWPMATAFTAEAIVGGLLVIIPLFSTVAMPITAHISCPSIKPVTRVALDRMEPAHTDHTSASGPKNSGPQMKAVVLFNDNPNAIYRGAPVDVTTNLADVRDPEPRGKGDKKLNEFMFDGPTKPNVKFGGPKRIISQLSEGQLVNRVEPVYPRIAAISGIQGQVKLHAIIGRDGRIQSLNAISGHPLLLRAALDAVEQWRYRPYVLNGEAVEVETFITVNFKKEMH